MAKEEWTVIKEFEKTIDGDPYIIKARILQLKSRSSSKIYHGRVSHYCKPSIQASGVMRPHGHGNSIDSVERELNLYINTFTSIGVEENEDFDRLKY